VGVGVDGGGKGGGGLREGTGEEKRGMNYVN